MGFNSGFKGLIVVNCFSFKITIFYKRKKLNFFMFDVIRPFYISLHSWPSVDKLCTVRDRERFSVFWSRSLSPNVRQPMPYRHNRFIIFLCKYCGPGSVVAITTGYGLDGPGIESLWERDFLHQSRPALRLTQPPVQWVPGFSRG